MFCQRKWTTFKESHNWYLFNLLIVKILFQLWEDLCLSQFSFPVHSNSNLNTQLWCGIHIRSQSFNTSPLSDITSFIVNNNDYNNQHGQSILKYTYPANFSLFSLQALSSTREHSWTEFSSFLSAFDSCLSSVWWSKSLKAPPTSSRVKSKKSANHKH